jgi:lipid A 3-O-deacylase
MKKAFWAGVVAVSVAVALAGFGPPAAAVDGIAFEAGGGDGTDMGRIAVQWGWDRRWFQGGEWHLGGYWDLGLGYWTRDALPTENGSITAVGFTPVFRLQRNEFAGSYAEFAVGVHFLSRTQIGNKRLSTAFQFGDLLGIGYRFGTRAAWDIGLRYQHLSNGGIKKPNDGINFGQVRLQYHF